MKFFVDTADVNEIRELNDIGLLDGVTTNPSLIAKSGRQDRRGDRARSATIVEGPVSAEVTATEYSTSMIERGQGARRHRRQCLQSRCR